MKVRTDFVTNSSSSSYLSFTYTSDTLGKIIEKYREELDGLPDVQASYSDEKKFPLLIDGGFQQIRGNQYYNVGEHPSISDILSHIEDELFNSEMCDAAESSVFQAFSKELKEHKTEFEKDPTFCYQYDFMDEDWGESYCRDNLERYCEEIASWMRIHAADRISKIFQKPIAEVSQEELQEFVKNLETLSSVKTPKGIKYDW